MTNICLVAKATCVNGDANPSHVLHHFDLALCRRISSLAELCEEQSLTQVRMEYYPDQWDSKDFEDRTDLNYGELVVGPDAFWFRDELSSGGLVQSCMIPIRALQEAFMTISDEVVAIEISQQDAEMAAAEYALSQELER